jgi:hypothetical protein
MKIAIIESGETISLIAYNLCHVDGHGDYEVFPSRELVLDMLRVKNRAEKTGYVIEGANEQLILARKDQIDLTIFPQGRVIIERLIPDEAQLALDMIVSLLELEKVE